MPTFRRKPVPIEPDQEELLFLDALELHRSAVGIRVIAQPAAKKPAAQRLPATRKSNRKIETSEPMSGVKRRIADIGLRAVYPMLITWAKDDASYEHPVRKFKRVMVIAEYLLRLPEAWLVPFVEWALRDDAIGRNWQSAKGMPEPKPDRRHRESRGMYVAFHRAPEAARAKFRGDVLPESGKWADHSCGKCGLSREAPDGTEILFQWVRKQNTSGKTVRKPSSYCEDCAYWRRRGQ